MNKVLYGMVEAYCKDHMIGGFEVDHVYSDVVSSDRWGKVEIETIILDAIQRFIP